MKRTLRRVWNRLLGSLRLRNSDVDLADEIDAHIQLMADDDIRRGVPPAEALRRARIQFGGVDSAKEFYRDQRGFPSLDSLAQDIRYSLRGIRKNPGFAAVAILSLAIGIGANTAIFSVVNAVLLQPLPFPNQDRIFAVREVLPRFTSSIPVNPLHAHEWAKHCPSLEQVALIRNARYQLNSGGEPESIIGGQVPHNLFSLYGVKPILGRTFLPEEEQPGKNRVVVLSETLWRSHFRADPGLVGRTIQLNEQNFQVVGIIPAWFRLPFSAGIVEQAVTVRMRIFSPLVFGQGELSRLMGNFNYNAAARLKPGATAEQALAEINVVQARFPQQAGSSTELKATLIPIHELIAGRARLGLWMLAGSVGAVLLIVCINLANLLLSRIASRRQEAAIRTALGASRGRQFRLVLMESLLLSFTGGVLGVLLARWLLQLLVASTTLDLPRLEEVRLDPYVLAFSFCLTVLTGFLCGALPAWRLTHTNPQESLHSGSRTATEGHGGVRLRQALIGLEVGLSAALLILAGLLTTSLTRLLEVDKGFDMHRVLTVDLRLAGNLYAQEVNRQRLFDRILAKVNAMPGVHSAGIITALPTQGETWLDPIYLEGNTRPEGRHTVNNRFVSPGYFRAMNIPIRAGQAFEDRDRDRRVAVLSQKAAKRLWPDVPNPVGRRFIAEDNKPVVLIGIAADVRATLQDEAPPTVYYPYWQRVPGSAYLVVRTAANANAAAALRAALRSEDAQLPLPPIRTMEEVVERSVSERRFQMTLIVGFAVAALLVAILGIYGVVSYSVTRRRNEIGIRMALGAQRSQLLALVMRQGMAPVVLGLAAGIGVAYFLAQAIRGLLFDIQPADPTTISLVAAILLAVGILACLIPAHRAATTDAISALRID